MQALYLLRKGDKVKGRFEFQIQNIAFASSYRTVIAFIEFGGSLTATRAVWAHLMRHRIATSSDSPDPTSIQILVEGSWDTLYQVAKERYISQQIGENIVVMRKTFSKDTRSTFIGGTLTEPSPYFLSAFRQRFTDIPVLPEWKQELWDAGIKGHLIVPMKSYSENGLSFWEFESHGYGGTSWEEIVKAVACGTA